MRVCFGRPWRKSIRRVRVTSKRSVLHTKVRNPCRNPCASSTRGVADFIQGGHSHTQSVRDCVALGYWKAERQAILDMPPARHITLLISFGESDTNCEIDSIKGVFSLIMIHCTMLWFERDSDVQHKLELCIPPGLLLRKTASSILTAVTKRLPVSLRELKARTQSLAIIPVSDSARACLKVGRNFLTFAGLSRDQDAEGANLLDGVVTLHSICLMHQVALVVASVLKMLDVTCPMFCCCVLLQNGHNRRAVRKHVLAYLPEQIKVVAHALPSRSLSLRIGCGAHERVF
jgi:hypothetical protein